MVSKGLNAAMFVHNVEKKIIVDTQSMTLEWEIVQDLIISSTIEVNLSVKATLCCQ